MGRPPSGPRRTDPSTRSGQRTFSDCGPAKSWARPPTLSSARHWRVHSAGSSIIEDVSMRRAAGKAGSLPKGSASANATILGRSSGGRSRSCPRAALLPQRLWTECEPLCITTTSPAQAFCPVFALSVHSRYKRTGGSARHHATKIPRTHHVGFSPEPLSDQPQFSLFPWSLAPKSKSSHLDPSSRNGHPLPRALGARVGL